MLIKILLTSALTLLLLLGWLGVQHLTRLYALRHPEFGPAREEGGGCGKSCGCHGGSCQHSMENA